MKNVKKTFQSFLSVLKFSIVVPAIFLALTLTSCGDNLKDDLDEVFSTTYTFYAQNPEEDSETSRVSINYKIGETLTKATLPSTKSSNFAKLKVGYKINGWIFYNNPLTLSTVLPTNITTGSSDDGNESNIIQKILVTSAPATFYVSEWNPITYYIILDGNGGTFTTDDGIFTETEPYAFTYDTAANLAENPFTRNGYIFNGWLRNQNTNSTVPDLRNGEEIFNLTITDEETIRLYALWLKDKIKISFAPGEGNGTMADIENVSVGDTLPKCTFTVSEEGKQFSSWQWTSSDGNRQCWYGDEATLDEGNYPNEDATLVAQWWWIPCQVTLHKNAGNDTCHYQHFDWGQEQSLITFEEINTNIENIENDTETFVRTGYDFAGWNTSADGSGTSYADGASLTIKEDLNLYAQWTVQSCTISFDANSGSGIMASQSFSFTDLPKTLTSNAFTREGHTFTGWNTSADGMGTAYSDGETITDKNWAAGNITLYAQWQINTYSVTFNSNGGNDVDSQTVNWGDCATSPTSEKTGYNLEGWYTDSALTNKFNFDTPIKQNYTLYAKWTEQTRTVKFVSNSGTGTMADATVSFTNWTSYNPANGFTRAGYNFSGWDKSDPYWNTSDVTFTANWTAKGTVNVNSNIENTAQVTHTTTEEGIVFTSGKTATTHTWSIDGVTYQSGNSCTVLYSDTDYNDGAEHTIICIAYTADSTNIEISKYSATFKIN